MKYVLYLHILPSWHVHEEDHTQKYGMNNEKYENNLAPA